MMRAIDGANNVAIRIRTAYAATMSLFYLESPNFFSVGNLNWKAIKDFAVLLKACYE